MPGDSQSLTFPELYESPSNVNRSKFTEREAFVSNAQSLSHTKWECKYHLTHGYRNTAGKSYVGISGSIWVKCSENWRGEEKVRYWKDTLCQIMPICLSPFPIPPKYAVSQVVGFIKGKSAIHIAREFFGRRKNFTGEEFWARGYHVSTVGKNEDAIRKYIKDQEREDRRIDQ